MRTIFFTYEDTKTLKKIGNFVLRIDNRSKQTFYNN